MSDPININGKNIMFNPNKNEYLYKIIIHFKNETKKEVVKLALKKYIKLIKSEEEINYDNIKSFNLIIQNISNMTTFSFDSEFIQEEDEDDLDDINFKTFRNTEIYLEFSKNNKKNTECNCYLNAFDNNRIFVTPPNY